MQFKTTLMISAISCTIGLSASAFAHEHGQQGRAAKGHLPEGKAQYRVADKINGKSNTCHQIENIFAQLDLSEAQTAKLKDIKSSYKAKMKKEKMMSSKEKRSEIQALLSAKDFDEAKAKELVDSKSEMKQEHMIDFLEHQHEMLSVLTPDQKKQYFQLMSKSKNSCKKTGKDQKKSVKAPK